MILYLAERLKAGKLDAAQQDFVDRLPHELRAVEFVARDELQYSAALGLIWLRLLAVHVAQERPDKASAARQIVQRFQTGQPANANVLNQLRDLEAGLLELWLLFRPATDRNESQAINGVAEG